jgi:hypothetical protein
MTRTYARAQPVYMLRDRSRSEYRPPQVALSVHAERQPRLGFHRRPDPCGPRKASRASYCCTPTATECYMCLTALTEGCFWARRSCARPEIPVLTRTAGRRSFRTPIRSPRAASLCFPNPRSIFMRHRTVRIRLAVSDDLRFGHALLPHAVRI